MARTADNLLAFAGVVPGDPTHQLPNALSTLLAIAILCVLYFGTGWAIRAARGLKRSKP